MHAGAGHGREGDRYEISLLSLEDERSCFFGREVGRVIFQGAYEASDSQNGIGHVSLFKRSFNREATALEKGCRP